MPRREDGLWLHEWPRGPWAGVATLRVLDLLGLAPCLDCLPRPDIYHLVRPPLTREISVRSVSLFVHLSWWLVQLSAFERV